MSNGLYNVNSSIVGFESSDHAVSKIKGIGIVFISSISKPKTSRSLYHATCKTEFLKLSPPCTEQHSSFEGRGVAQSRHPRPDRSRL